MAIVYPKTSRAERERQIEIDHLAEKLIRERGISAWQAISEASRQVTEQRGGAR